MECTTRRAVALREQWLGTIDAETRQAMRDPITGIFESGGAMDEGRALGRTLLARDIEAVGSEGADAMDTWYLLVQYGTYDSDTAIGKLRGLPAWNRRERGDRHPQRFRSYTPWPTSMCRRGDWTRRRR
ncbi:MAG: hypothetical protein D6788_06800 [Planctomycetota bacterium]|nr:MAG: hypothetical protein D6788_06800 [Planctomycetota bacterium]